MVIGAEQQKGEAESCDDKVLVGAKRAVRSVPMVGRPGCFGVVNSVNFHVGLQGCLRRIPHGFGAGSW